MYRRGKLGRFYERFILPNGKEKRICLGTSDEKLARLKKTKIEMEIFAGGYELCKPKQMSVSSLLNQYMDTVEHSLAEDTLKSYNSKCGTLKKKFGNMYLEDITPEVLDRYVAERNRNGRKPGSTGETLRLFKRAWRLAIHRWKRTTNDPFVLMKLPTCDAKRSRYLLDDEFEKLTTVFSMSKFSWYRDIFCVARDTGLRRKNLCNMTFENNVDLDNRELRFSEAEMKTQALNVPMSILVFNIIKQRFLAQKSGPVFLDNFGKKVTRAKATGTWIKIRREAGVKDFRLHDLRHDFCSRLVQAGESLQMVSKLAGHCNIQQTDRYAHLCPEQKAKSIAVLDKPKLKAML